MDLLYRRLIGSHGYGNPFVGGFSEVSAECSCLWSLSPAARAGRYRIDPVRFASRAFSIGRQVKYPVCSLPIPGGNASEDRAHDGCRHSGKFR